MKCLKAIFAGLNVRDEIQKDAFLEFRRILDDAVEKGYRQVAVKADPFLDMLRHGNAVISAFKTHRMQNDMAARLLDKDGRLKPFRTWMRDVKDIASHYTVRWLRTEYDTAVLRAHEAAAWMQARQEADVLPNLRWMPTTSASPDVIHKAFWSMKLTLPVNHPFWKKHRPQDRWGCKCSIMQTDEPATELKGLGKADRIKPVPGLDNNPADDGMVFGKSHPYITKAYPGAEKAVRKLLGDEADYTIIPTKKGVLRIHSGHGKKERDENIRIGKYLVEKYGYEIDLVDNPSEKKSADSYNKTLGLTQEYKVNSTPTKGSIDNLLRDAKKQADDIVLWIDSDISWGDLTAALRSRVRRSENIKTVTIIKNNHDISLSREDILNDSFKIRPTDLK